MNYICEGCGHQFSSDKVRKRCPKCKKQKLTVKKKDRVDELSEFTTKIRGDNVPLNRDIFDENGNKIGRKTIGVPVQAKPMKCMDLKEVASDPDDKKVAKALKSGKQSLSPRREGIKKIEVKCSMCGKSNLVNPLLAAGSVYRCDNCIRWNAGR